MKLSYFAFVIFALFGVVPMAESGWCATCVTQPPCPIPPGASDDTWFFCGVWDDDQSTNCLYWEKRERNCGLGITGWEYRSHLTNPGSCVDVECL